MKALTILTLVVLGLIPLHAAEKAPVHITAELGFANLFYPGRPLPFRVDLSDAVRPIEGKLRIIARNGSGGETIYEQPVSLVPGAHKRWRLTLPPIAVGVVKVQLLDNRGRFLDEQVFFGFSIDTSASLVLVVQDESISRFAFPRKPGEIERGGLRTASVDPESLPEDPLAYAGVSAILWRMDKEQTLNKAQAETLLGWIRQGGLLVVAGGRAVPPNLPREFHWGARWDAIRPFELSKLADADLLPPLRPLTAQSRKRLANWEQTARAEVKVGVRPLIGDGAQARLQVGDLQLITEQLVGGGAVMQLAFDPHDLAAQGCALGNDFWEQALWLGEPQQTKWRAMQWLSSLAADQTHTALALAAEYRVESVWQIAWVFGAFFTVAFGVNFFVFRKSRRYEWAWLILIVASMGLFAYHRAFGRVGGFGPTRHFEITSSYGMTGEKSLLNFTEVGLLSPRSRNEWIKPLSSSQLLFGIDDQHRVVQLDGEKQFFPLRTRAGAFATCASVSCSELPGDGIIATWDTESDPIKLTIVNKTGLPLQSPRCTPTIGNLTTQGKDTFVWLVSQQELLNLVLKEGTPPPAPNPRRGPSRFAPPPYYDEPNPPPPPTIAGALVFTFELPLDAAACTASSATQVRCKRTVMLALPTPEIRLTSLPPKKGPL